MDPLIDVFSATFLACVVIAFLQLLLIVTRRNPPKGMIVAFALSLLAGMVTLAGLARYMGGPLLNPEELIQPVVAVVLLFAAFAAALISIVITIICMARRYI